MNWSLLAIAAALLFGPAIFEHAIVTSGFRDIWGPKRWWCSLHAPRFGLPYVGYQLGALACYLMMTAVIFRGLEKMDIPVVVLSLVVSGLSQLLSVYMFQTKDLRGTTILVLPYLVPMTLLQLAVLDDGISGLLVSVWFAWIIYTTAVVARMYRLDTQFHDRRTEADNAHPIRQEMTSSTF